MGSPGAPNNIGYNARFLVSGFSSTNRHALHDVTDLGTIGVSRGGAIVHELTRPYLDTADLVIPLGVLTPLSKGSQAGVKTYGPYACCAVGKFAPDLSITNADTYRVFCEDAWASRHGGVVTATPTLPGENVLTTLP